jgi:hypothetical protein
MPVQGDRPLLEPRQREAVHFLKSAQVQTGGESFVRPVEKQRANRTNTVWKVFTSEQDYQSYLTTGKHRRR